MDKASKVFKQELIKLLNIIEELDKPIKAGFFVSGFLKLLGNETFDSINQSFVDRQFNWQNILKNCKHFSVYHSDNDPYVSIECADELAQKLKTKSKIVSNAGHFNENAGYKKFELLLEDIRKVIE